MVEDLSRRGLAVVDSVEQIPCGKVIVRSHGITKTDRDALQAKGVRIIDATCPFVTKAQEHAEALSREGYAVIVVGDADHPEVKSIMSFIAPGVPVLTTLEQIRRRGGIRKAGIVAQTTQSFERLMEFAGEALRKYPEVRVFNTICNATILRQKESVEVAGRAEVMVVLGGYNSANTRRLAELCGEINPRTVHLETAGELSPDLVKEARSVGITAGASTPQWIIEGLVDRLREIWGGEQAALEYYK